PYGDSLKHTLYSTSKSFTSTAIGFLVSEKKITVQDKVISFFPDKVPDTISDYLKELTVQNLLTMSVGHEKDPSGVIPPQNDWTKAFLATPIVNKPGSQFLYNSMATYMLSAIVQKVSGEKVIDYLEPRLFKPLGITNKDWETNGQDINTGGWGLRLSTRDMAKFGLLFLNKGKWNGKQILPAAWIEEASTAHIKQKPDATAEELASSEWLQGYGYQFWRSRYNSYRADGAFGQYILVLPELDAVIAINCETPDMQNEINLVWQYLKPAMGPKALPADPKALQALATEASQLKVNPRQLKINANQSKVNPNQSNVNPNQSEVNPNQSKVKTDQLKGDPTAKPAGIKFANKTFTLNDNQNKLLSVNFNTTEKGLAVSILSETGKSDLMFGDHNWLAGSTGIKGPSLTSHAVNSLQGLAPFKIAGEYSWIDDNTLELFIQYTESAHRWNWTCHFDAQGIKIERKSSFANFKEVKVDETITGK
ncbi:MAG: class C beta-lactamase-related serine hydrolase, partial [Chitinophagaceae bacterium]